jgi:hypothetical protein
MEIAGKGETQHILESAQQARRFLYSISTNT